VIVWLAVLAIIVPAIVSIVALIVQHRSGAQTREHDRQMRREDRIQERRASTYVDMIELMMSIHEAADRLPEKPQPGLVLPPLVPAEETRPVEARMKAFASVSVKQLLEEWSGLMRQFRLEANKYAEMMAFEAQPGRRPSETKEVYGEFLSDQIQKILEIRDRAFEKQAEIETQIASELAPE
jgi:heme exporter protein D